MGITWIIDQRFIGKTLRSFLAFHHLGKAMTHRLFQERRMTVNDHVILHDHIFKENDTLHIDFENDVMVDSDHHPIDIVYEDQDLLILNKPQGLLVHDDGVSDTSLSKRVNGYREVIKYPYRILPAHRIDKETTGLIVFAKHPLSLSYLSHLFESQTLEKIYYCEVKGHLKDEKGLIDLPIANDRHSNKMRVDPKGKDAKTYYEVIEKKKETTLLKVRIYGGRTHQIRVHFSYKGFPVVGDSLYDRPGLNPLKLHFSTLRMVHPRTGEMLEISTQPPFINASTHQ